MRVGLMLERGARLYTDLKWNHKANAVQLPKQQDMGSVSPYRDDVNLAGSEILKTGGRTSKKKLKKLTALLLVCYAHPSLNIWKL